MHTWQTLNPYLLEEEQRARLANVRALRLKQVLLAEAGYVSPGRRLRVTAAAWLLRLALLLDARITTPVAEPAPPLPGLRHA